MANEHPRELALRKLNLMIAQDIESQIPPGVGFTLLLYDFGPNGFMTYSSSANRDDMLKAIRELLIVVEGDKDNKPT